MWGGGGERQESDTCFVVNYIGAQLVVFEIEEFQFFEVLAEALGNRTQLIVGYAQILQIGEMDEGVWEPLQFVVVQIEHPN